MKTKRQRKIIELITERNVETQDELAALLEKEGFTVTQATISRDIRELNITNSFTGWWTEILHCSKCIRWHLRKVFKSIK